MKLFRKKGGSVKYKDSEAQPQYLDRVPTAKEWFSQDSDEEKSTTSRYSLHEDELPEDADKYSKSGLQSLWSESIDSPTDPLPEGYGYDAKSPTGEPTTAEEGHTTIEETPSSSSVKERKSWRKKSDKSDASKRKWFVGRSRQGSSPNRQHQDNNDAGPATLETSQNGDVLDEPANEKCSPKEHQENTADFGITESSNVSIDVTAVDTNNGLGVKMSESLKDDANISMLNDMPSLSESMSGSYEVIEAVETVYEEESDEEQEESPTKKRQIHGRSPKRNFFSPSRRQSQDGQSQKVENLQALVSKLTQEIGTLEKDKKVLQSQLQGKDESKDLGHIPNSEEEASSSKDTTSSSTSSRSFFARGRKTKRETNKKRKGLQKGFQNKAESGRQSAMASNDPNETDEGSSGVKSEQPSTKNKASGSKWLKGGALGTLMSRSNRMSPSRRLSKSVMDSTKNQDQDSELNPNQSTETTDSPMGRVSAAERNTMYGRSLMTQDSAESEDPGSPVNISRKVNKSFQRELDEFPNAEPHGYHDNEPQLVQCLKFYYCGGAARCADTVHKKTSCQPELTESRDIMIADMDDAPMTPRSDASSFTEDETVEDEAKSPEPTVEIVLDEDVRDDIGITDRGSIDDLEEAPVISPALSRSNSYVRDVTDLHLSLETDSDVTDERQAFRKTEHRKKTTRDESQSDSSTVDPISDSSTSGIDSNDSTIPTGSKKKKKRSVSNKKKDRLARFRRQVTSAEAE